MARTLAAMLKAAALAVLVLAAAGPLAAQPLPNDSYRGANDFTPSPPPPPSDAVGRLQQLLPEKEPATFAGLWVTDRDNSTIAVAFTKDAAATLAKYTKDPRFKPVTRPGPTQAELYAEQDRLIREFARLGARPMAAWSDIKEGRVKIEIVGDMVGVKAAVARGDLTVPPYLDVIEPPPIKYPAPPSAPAGYVSPVKAFPRFAHRGGGIMTLELRVGRVILGPDGCLRLEGDRHSPVIVWPNEAALDLSRGDVRIFDRMSGQTIVAGEQITLGGSSGRLSDDSAVIDADPACPGPYLRLTGFGSYARLEAQMFDRQIEEYATTHKISRAEARRVLEAQGERNRQLRVFGSDLQRAFPEVFGEMVVFEGKATLKLAGDLPVPIPEEYARDITIERVPRSAAALDAERNAILDQIEALGLEGVSAGSDIEAGRVTLNVGDQILQVADAIRAGHLTLPDDVQLMTNGAGPAGSYSEWNMEAAWKALEAAPDFTRIRDLVAATDIPFYGEAPRKTTPQGATEMARWLVMLGFTADEITRLRAVGIDPVIDWEAQNGRATLENRAALAEHVVVGEVVSIDPHALLNDGFRTTATFRVIEALKGAARPGDILPVRLESGFTPDGTLAQTNGDPMLLEGLPGALKVGDRYVLFLSSGQYANAARHAGGKPRPGLYALRQEMSRVLPTGALARTYAEAAPAPTLDDLRRRIAPVQAKFEAAGVR